MTLRTTDIPQEVISGTDTLARQAVERLFGPQAVFVTEPQTSGMWSLAEEPVFMAVSMAVLVFYFYVVFVFSDDLKLYVREMFSSQSVGMNEATKGRLTTTGFTLFMNVMGLIAFSLLAEDCMWRGGLIPEGRSVVGVQATLTACFLGWGAYRWLLLSVTGVLIGNKALCARLNDNQNRFFALLSLVLVPFSMMVAFGPQRYDTVVYDVFIVLVVLYFAAYFFRTWHLFVKEKISILLLILYLCTVDIVPVTTIVVKMLGIR